MYQRVIYPSLPHLILWIDGQVRVFIIQVTHNRTGFNHDFGIVFQHRDFFVVGEIQLFHAKRSHFYHVIRDVGVFEKGFDLPAKRAGIELVQGNHNAWFRVNHRGVTSYNMLVYSHH